MKKHHGKETKLYLWMGHVLRFLFRFCADSQSSVGMVCYVIIALKCDRIRVHQANLHLL